MEGFGGGENSGEEKDEWLCEDFAKPVPKALQKRLRIFCEIWFLVRFLRNPEGDWRVSLVFRLTWQSPPPHFTFEPPLFKSDASPRAAFANINLLGPKSSTQPRI